jgi:hypothetical protein
MACSATSSGWALLAVALIAGLILAVVRARRSGELAARLAPLGLLVGSVLFLVITVTGRASSFGSTYALQPRYAYLVAAMTLPALAVTDFRLSFDRAPTGHVSDACKPLRHAIPLRLKPGDVIGVFDNPLVVRSAKVGMLVPLLFRPTDGSSVVVLSDPGPVILTPRNGFAPPRVCLPAGSTGSAGR